MKNKYDLVFYYISEWSYPRIKSENDLYFCVSYLSSFFRIDQLELEIIPFAKKIINGDCENHKEWMEPSEQL